MALEFDLRKVGNVDILRTKGEDGQENWSQLTTRVVFSCISTGINEITEDNYEEWFQRNFIWDTVHGLLPLPLESVKLFIGLWTNASTLTKAEFNKRIMADIWYNAETQMREEADA